MKEKLIDILVENLEEWPFEGGSITQDSDGGCYWVEESGDDIFCEEGFWHITGSELDHVWEFIDTFLLASDWDEAIITEEMWRKAKNPSPSSPPYAVGEIIETNINCDEWMEVRVVGWGKHGEDDCITLCELYRGEDSQLHVSIYTGYEHCFRNSSKTKLTEKVVKVLSHCNIPLIDDEELTTMAHSLYDNGLLKKEEGCEGLD